MNDPKSEPSPEQLRQSRRRFLKQAMTLGVMVSVSSLLSEAPAKAVLQSPAVAIPGTPKPWGAAENIYSGVLNMVSSNALIIHPIVSWTGKGEGIIFDLYFNSQSSQTSPSNPLGPKWTHSFSTKIVASATDAKVIWGDGTEDMYAKSGTVYTAPAGVFNSLVQNSGGTWTLSHKEKRSQYQFDSSGNLIGVVYPNNLTTSLTYTSGNLTSVTDCSGRALSLGYSSGKITSITDFEGRVWQIAYTGGLLISVTPPLLSGNAYPTLFSYSSNNIASITNSLGATWGYGYSGNKLVSVTDPSNNTWGYSGAALVAAPETPELDRSEPGAIGVDEPTEAVAWPYEVTQSAAMQDPTGSSKQYGFDSYGRLIALSGATNERSIHTYNSNNLRTSTEISTGKVWQYAYDSSGNRTSFSDGFGNNIVTTYNALGLPLTVTEPTGITTSFQYDSAGNRTLVTDAEGNTVASTYNTAGLPIQVTDSRGQVSQFAYNNRGHLTSVTNPAGGVTQFAYEGNSDRIGQRTDALGKVTTYTYDAWGRETATAYPTSGRVGISTVLDTEGRVIQSTDATGTRSYTYDASGRRTGMTDPMGNTQTVYDSAGRRLSQTDVAGRTHTYTYDALKRPQTSSVDGQTVQVSYNSTGLISLKTFPNGTQAEYAYDAPGRVSTLTYRKQSNNAVLVAYAATYTAAGRIGQITESPSGDVTVYQHDDVGRVINETRTGVRSFVGEYTYDANGNRLTVFRSENGVASYDATYTYDNASRLIQSFDAVANTTKQYGWNANGTLASYPGPGYTRLLSYDEENHITQVRKDFGGGNIQVAFEYGYGADGEQRWRKDYGADTWSWYPCGVGCSAGALVEKVSNLQGQSWQVSALSVNVGGLVSRNGEYHYLNLLGNVEVVADASGNIISHNLYDSLGHLRAQSGNAATPVRAGRAGDEGLPEVMYMIQQAQAQQQRQQPDDKHCARQRERCIDWARTSFTSCNNTITTLCSTIEGIITVTSCMGRCIAASGGTLIPQCFAICALSAAVICFGGGYLFCQVKFGIDRKGCDIAHANCEKIKIKNHSLQIAQPV